MKVHSWFGPMVRRMWVVFLLLTFVAWQYIATAGKAKQGPLVAPVERSPGMFVIGGEDVPEIAI